MEIKLAEILNALDILESIHFSGDVERYGWINKDAFFSLFGEGNLEETSYHSLGNDSSGYYASIVTFTVKDFTFKTHFVSKFTVRPENFKPVMDMGVVKVNFDGTVVTKDGRVWKITDYLGNFVEVTNDNKVTD